MQKSLVLLIFCAALHLSIFPISTSLSPETAALLDIRSSLIDPLNHLYNWNDSQSPCQFAGVQCASDLGHVIGISLANSSLSGKLSPSFSLLHGLISLELGANTISGAVPPELANCSNLQVLNLSTNSLSGELPDLSTLNSLQILDLSTNDFSGKFPTWVGQLSSLTELGLGENSFEEGDVPQSIGNLKSLTWLFLGQCNLKGEIPASIFELTLLGTFDFSRNQISGEFPKAIANLHNLYKIELYQNNLTGEIPPELSNLTLLSEFDISRNQLAGKLPAELGSLKNLRIFHIYRNNFQGELPEGFGELQFLWSFSVYENGFSGSIPPNLGRLSPLNAIDISENNFSGDFPGFMCRNNNLQFLLALQNNFSGAFPESYSSCKTLQRFRISQNQFTGKIPDGLWGLPNAVIIDVADNSFVGGVSSDIGISAGLTQLYVQNNRLSGQLPTVLGNLSQLQKLVASNNCFFGQIPSQIGNLKQLSSLHLEQNAFDGPIPSEIGMCSSLVDLSLAQNSLTGNVPGTLALLSALNSLNLSHNSIKGRIPQGLQSLKLSYIDFSDNQLSGPIPPQLLVIAGDEAFSGNPGLCIDAVPGSWRYSMTNISFCNSTHSHGDFLGKHIVILVLILIAIVVLFAGLTFLSYANFKSEQSRRKKDYEGSKEEDSKLVLESFNRPELDPEEICHLDEENLLGSGGTGKVYKLDLSKGRGTVAVKQLWRRDESKALMAEISTLGRIRHRNILKLLAFLTGRGSNFLVYEYMPNGNLYQALRREFKGGQPELDWSRRYKIAVGAAKGVMYLHHDCSPAIIHRDIKSTNILLDEEYEAKLADFGIAMVAEDSSQLSSFAGTHGYIAPELAYSFKATEKSDVYSFGVVLLELLTGRCPTDSQSDDADDLISWVSGHMANCNPVDIFDARISGYDGDDMVRVLDIAVLCTANLPGRRPTMREVVNMLVDADPCCVVKKGKKDGKGC